MTNYTPQFQVGSENTLGYKVQSGGFGTPSYPTAVAAAWITQLSNTLNPDKGTHTIKTGHGTGTAERKFAPGPSGVKGDFGVPLHGTQGANLVAFWAGPGSDTTNTTGVKTGLKNHVIIPKPSLRYLSMEDQWAVAQGDGNGQIYRYHDVGLDQLDISQGADGFMAKYTAIGILDEASAITVPSQLQPTAPTFATPEDLLVYNWGHLQGAAGGTILFDGSDVAAMTNFSITAKRNLIAKYGGGGAFYYTRLGPGSLIITGSYDQEFDNQGIAQEFADYILTKQAPQAIVFALQTGDVSSSTGAATNTAITFNMGLAYIMSATKTWTPDDMPAIKVNFQVWDPWASGASGFSAVFCNADSAAY